jgi:hypothetical protein
LARVYWARFSVLTPSLSPQLCPHTPAPRPSPQNRGTDPHPACSVHGGTDSHLSLSPSLYPHQASDLLCSLHVRTPITPCPSLFAPHPVPLSLPPHPVPCPRLPVFVSLSLSQDTLRLREHAGAAAAHAGPAPAPAAPPAAATAAPGGGGAAAAAAGGTCVIRVRMDDGSQVRPHVRARRVCDGVHVLVFAGALCGPASHQRSSSARNALPRQHYVALLPVIVFAASSRACFLSAPCCIGASRDSAGVGGRALEATRAALTGPP